MLPRSEGRRRGEKWWSKVRAIERLRKRFIFCTPISGCLLET